jgi:hypothetical protein
MELLDIVDELLEHIAQLLGKSDLQAFGLSVRVSLSKRLARGPLVLIFQCPPVSEAIFSCCSCTI